MGPTAQQLQLRCDKGIDERLHFGASTDAALTHLEHLHRLFRNWTLALAAYNAGEGRVQKAIAVQGVNNFYHLSLPEETERYIHRILAAKIIVEDPARYRFEIPEDQLYPPLAYDEVKFTLAQEMPVRRLAEASGTYYKVIKDLNPWIRGDSLAPGTFRLKIPSGTIPRFQAAMRQPEPAGPVAPQPEQIRSEARNEAGNELSGAGTGFPDRPGRLGVDHEPGAGSLLPGAVALNGARNRRDGLPEEPAPAPPGQVLDYPQGLILPGLVNVHTHAAMSLFRGLADDLPLMQWLQDYIFPVEATLTGDLVYQGTLLAVAEMIKSGTTSFCDMYLFAGDVARAVEEAGMRAWIGEVLYDFPSPNYGELEKGFAYTQNLMDRYRNHPLVTVTLDPHAVYTCSPDLLTRLGAMAREEGRAVCDPPRRERRGGPHLPGTVRPDAGGTPRGLGFARSPCGCGSLRHAHQRRDRPAGRTRCQGGPLSGIESETGLGYCPGGADAGGRHHRGHRHRRQRLQ